LIFCQLTDFHIHMQFLKSVILFSVQYIKFRHSHRTGSNRELDPCVKVLDGCNSLMDWMNDYPACPPGVEPFPPPPAVCPKCLYHRAP
jgi:hypothetical protein